MLEGACYEVCGVCRSGESVCGALGGIEGGVLQVRGAVAKQGVSPRMVKS